MTPTAAGATYQLGEHHGFKAAGAEVMYLVPSGAIFALDEMGREIVGEVRERSRTREELTGILARRGHGPREIETALAEMEHSDALVRDGRGTDAPKVPATSFPLQRIVLNVTNQCNLACTYCYEYSEDKISKT